MAEYALGKARTRQRYKRHIVVHVSIKRAVYDRLALMRDALQREIGPDIAVTVPGMVRRILYQHAALRRLAMRHSQEETDTMIDMEE